MIFSRALIGALSLSLALAALPGSVTAQAAGTVTGTVVDERQRALQGVTVQLRGPVARDVATDVSGVFRFVSVPVGDYVVAVESLGYGRHEREVSVGGGTVTLEFVTESAPLAIAPLQVVATTRAGRTPATLPIKVDVIEQAEMVRQQTLVSNPTELLSNIVPSFSPGRQKLSSAGESFRGRRPLFLVDGVPQSNPLRDGRRDGFTIGMEAIERVEVVFGANAIQGLGATGGIINYVTISPDESGELRQRLSLSSTTADDLEGDAFGWRANYLASQRFGEVDVLGSVSWEERGLLFDANGRAIGVDNVQGDIADSRSRNFFGKVGWEPTAAQRLQLMVSDFELEQEGSWVSVDGDRTAGMPTSSVEGEVEGVAPINDVTTISLDYTHRDVLGGEVSAKAYHQDFAALYGGGRFATFQDPDIAPVGELFDQSQNNSRKYGTRLTYAGERLGEAPVDLVAGFDFLRDETYQSLYLTGRNWVPVTRFKNYAPFAQLDVDVTPFLTLSGGLRWEIAQLDVPGFTTIAGNRPDFQRVSVEGGAPSFDEPLLNVGGVLTPVEGLRFYGSFAQAFTMPDVGRVLRGVSEPGTAVGDFLDLQPIQTDNLEVGGAYATERTRFGLTWFSSESDFGVRLVPNVDGIFQVRREPTRTSGWEVTGRFDPTADVSLTAAYSILEGRFDGDDDGTFESDLGAADIGPNRLNVGVDGALGQRFTGRLQAFRYFDRDFRDADADVTASFDGYTTLDASLSGTLARTTVTVSVSNLLDTQYITYYSQAGTNRDDRYFAGRGRTLTLRLDTRF